MRLYPQIQINGENFLQDDENYYGKMGRNMVPLAKYGSLLYLVYGCLTLAYSEQHDPQPLITSP